MSISVTAAFPKLDDLNTPSESIQSVTIDGETAMNLSRLISEELQKEREALLAGVERLLTQYQAVTLLPGANACTPDGAWSPPPMSSSSLKAQMRNEEAPVIELPVKKSIKSDDPHLHAGTENAQAVPWTKGKCEGSMKQKHAEDLTLMEEIRQQQKHMQDLTKASASGLLDLSGDPERRARALEKIVDGHCFEIFCGLMISLNVVLMAVKMQYQGFDTGYAIGAPSFESPAADIWPMATIIFQVLEAIFNTWFVIELVLRIAAGRAAALKSRWIQLDFLLVSLSLLDATGLLAGFNPSMIRMLRFLRMLRMLKLIQGMAAFEALIFFIKAIEESIGALLWCFVVLLFIQLAVGMVLHQILSLWINDQTQDPDARRRVFAYFGSFTNTMMTMFEITLANWVVTCRMLMTDVSEWFGLFYILYRCMFCFGAVRVITAVFIAQTNRAVAKDDDLVVMMQEKEREQFRKKMEEMFESLDTSRDGYLSWSEFEVMTEDPLWRSWGRKLELPMNDLVSLFELLAGSDRRVSAKEFFHGIQRLKGPAKSVDVVWLLSEFGKHLQSDRLLATSSAPRDPESSPVHVAIPVTQTSSSRVEI